MWHLLADCASWLRVVRQRCDNAPVATEEGPVRPRVLMVCALDYACECVAAVQDELSAGRPLQAAALARILFEVAARVCWASLTDDGWARLMKYWIEEHKKPLNRVQANPCGSTVKARASIEDLLHNYETWLASPEVASLPLCPDMRTLLREIDDTVFGEAGRPQQGEGPYAGYQDLCRYAHANMTVCAGGVGVDKIGPLVATYVACATIQLVEAQARTFGAALDEASLDALYRLVPDA